MVLDGGAGVGAKADGGLTPLMLAAGNNNREVCELLISKGGDPCAKDDEGRTARDYAEDEELKRML